MDTDGGDLVVLTPRGYHRLCNEGNSTEVLLWEHSYNSPGRSSLSWEGERWAEPAAVPSLVLELALSQLRSLLEAASQDSLASEEEEAPRELASELYPDDVEERP